MMNLYIKDAGTGELYLIKYFENVLRPIIECYVRRNGGSRSESLQE